MPSTIPARLGLPPLSDVGKPNLAEGVVLRPRAAGATGAHHPRAMLKLKGESFYERAPGHAAAAAEYADAVCGGKLAAGLAGAWLDHICVSRLASVRSKHSEEEFRDRATMVAELVADAEGPSRKALFATASDRPGRRGEDKRGRGGRDGAAQHNYMHLYVAEHACSRHVLRSVPSCCSFWTGPTRWPFVPLSQSTSRPRARWRRWRNGCRRRSGWCCAARRLAFGLFRELGV